MKFAVFLMICLLLFLLAGAFPVDEKNSQLLIFKTPAFILLAGALVISLLSCCWKRRKLRSLRGTGFHITHLGMMLIIIGAFIGFVSGEREKISVPLLKHVALNRFRGVNGNIVEFEFKISASNFLVQFYPPQYALYRPSKKSPDGFQYITKFSVSDDKDIIHIKGYGAISTDELRENESEWKSIFYLPNGSILQRLQDTPKHFEAKLHFTNQTGEELTQKVMVNHPISFKGWRFYLSNYDPQGHRYIILDARRDPGRSIVIIGLWAVIFGVALICLIKAEESKI